VVVRIEPELIRVFCPAFADVFVRCQASKGFEALGKVGGGQEVFEVFAELIVAVVVVAPDSGILNCPVHSLDLTIGPRVTDFCQPVLDGIFPADAHEDVLECAAVPFPVDELDAIIGEDGVDPVGDGANEVSQDLCSHRLSGLGVELGEGKLGRSVNSHKEIELALFGSDLGYIDVKVPDRVFFEGFLGRFAPSTSGSRLIHWRW
jgi:hypothetical protein